MSRGLVGLVIVVVALLWLAQRDETTRTASPPTTAVKAEPVRQWMDVDFARIVADTGCGSKSSDEKKADIFNANYKGRWMTLTGEIATLSTSDLSLKILPRTYTFDIRIKLRDPRAGYDLEKGQRVKVKFVMTGVGGCFLSYDGEQGEVVE